MFTFRALIFSSLILLCIAAPAQATGSLSFEGGGYFVDLTIGLTEVPVVASVRFYQPGDQRGVLLPSEQVLVQTFDVKRQALVLRFTGSIGTDAIKPFTLTVVKRRAILQINARRIVSKFNWSM
jgi:hypothetical protein